MAKFAAADEITSMLQKTGCSCLNEQQAYPHKNLFAGGGDVLPLRSDCDPELLLQLAFMQTISMHSIIIGLPETDSCPKTIKLFCNRNNMGFDDAKEINPVQQIDVEMGTTSLKIDLIASKWNRTDTITLFIEDNHGNDMTEIHSIRLFGKALMSTDVSQIKKC